MRSWQEELLKITESTDSEQEVFRRIESAAKSMGFEHCAYGLRVPWPLTNPKILMVNNYTSAWQQRYADSGYLFIDPQSSMVSSPKHHWYGRRTSLLPVGRFGKMLAHTAFL